MTNEMKPHELGWDVEPAPIGREEWIARAEKLMPDIYGRQVAPTPQHVTEMFVLYNMAFVPKMHSRSCSSCVSRVHKRMSHWYLKFVLEPAEAEAAAQTQTKKKKDKKDDTN